jgi:hypothetical protein
MKFPLLSIKLGLEVDFTSVARIGYVNWPG